MRWLGILSVGLFSVALSACGGGGEDTTSGRTVVAAFYPLAWAAEQIGGVDTEVVNLTPPGAEPHDIELSPRDVETVNDADLVLYLGQGFMPALEDTVRGNDNAVDLLAGERLLAGGEAHDHEAEQDVDESGADPHIWLDPTRFASVVARIGETLGEPESAQELVADLERLDDELLAGLETCTRREIITSHAAFSYLADAYGLEQIALTGLSPEAEPSPRALEELVHEVEITGATTVFFETLVSARLAETVAREASVGTAALNPLEGLDEEELAGGADYFSVMRENLVALRKALGCL